MRAYTGVRFCSWIMAHESNPGHSRNNSKRFRFNDRRTPMTRYLKYIPCKLAALLMPALLLLPLAGCSGESNTTPGTSAEIRLQRAGATFPNPLYQKWFSEYN